MKLWIANSIPCVLFSLTFSLIAYIYTNCHIGFCILIFVGCSLLLSTICYFIEKFHSEKEKKEKIQNIVNFEFNDDNFIKDYKKTMEILEKKTAETVKNIKNEKDKK